MSKPFVPCTTCFDPQDCYAWGECYKFGDPESDPNKGEQTTQLDYDTIEWMAQSIRDTK